MGKVVIINRYILKLGGIETYVCRLIPFMLNHDVRVIWIRQRDNAIGSSFSDVLKDKRLEYCYVNNPDILWFNHEKIKLSKDDKVIILSFNPSSFAKSLTLCREYRGIDITPFYYVPDTTGPQYFRERYFPGFLGRYFHGSLSKLFRRFDSYNLIRFFSPLQVTSLEQAYGLTIQDSDKKILKSNEEYPPFDEENVKLRAKERRRNFNIITVGRFDFPHKGYILGLIRAYGRLKQNYMNLHLTIVGYGPHENRVREEISKLPDYAQKDLHLVGETPPEDLQRLFYRSHLNISVAGAVGDGAKYSVLSIPARNYCEGECEVYGLNYEPSVTVSTKPGHLVDDDIIRVINMSSDDYINETLRIHKLFRTDSEPWYVFDTLSMCQKKMNVKRKDVNILKCIEYLRKILTVFHFLILKVFVNRQTTFTQVIEKGVCPMVILFAFGVIVIICVFSLAFLIVSFI